MGFKLAFEYLRPSYLERIAIRFVKTFPGPETLKFQMKFDSPISPPIFEM
jgi:hypothetical protein